MNDDLLTRTLRRIEVTYGTHGWHDDDGPPPSLFVLHQLSPAKLTVVELVVPPHLWELADPGDVLLGLSKYVETDRRLLRPFGDVATWYGMAIAMEAWMVAGALNGPSSPDFLQQLDADARARRIHARPDRISIRAVTGVCRDMTNATIMRREDTDEVIDDNDRVRMTGAVLHGLNRLVAAVDTLIDPDG